MIPDNLFTNLKILGKIQKNDKLKKSKNGSISLDNGYFCRLKRFIRNDSRLQTIQEIKSIFLEIDNFITNHLDRNDLSILNEELDKVKIGIENLKFTYYKDNLTSSQLEIFIIQLNNYKTRINDKKNNLLSYSNITINV